MQPGAPDHSRRRSPRCGICPSRVLTSELLPPPFGPTSACTLPASTRRRTPSRMRLPPRLRSIPANSMAGPQGVAQSRSATVMRRTPGWRGPRCRGCAPFLPRTCRRCSRHRKYATANRASPRTRAGWSRRRWRKSISEKITFTSSALAVDGLLQLARTRLDAVGRLDHGGDFQAEFAQQVVVGAVDGGDAEVGGRGLVQPRQGVGAQGPQALA